MGCVSAGGGRRKSLGRRASKYELAIALLREKGEGQRWGCGKGGEGPSSNGKSREGREEKAGCGRWDNARALRRGGRDRNHLRSDATWRDEAHVHVHVHVQGSRRHSPRASHHVYFPGQPRVQAAGAHFGHVCAEAAVDAGAPHAKKHPQVDRCPGRARPPAVSAVRVLRKLKELGESLQALLVLLRCHSLCLAEVAPHRSRGIGAGGREAGTEGRRGGGAGEMRRRGCPGVSEARRRRCSAGRRGAGVSPRPGPAVLPPPRSEGPRAQVELAAAGLAAEDALLLLGPKHPLAGLVRRGRGVPGGCGRRPVRGHGPWVRAGAPARPVGRQHADVGPRHPAHSLQCLCCSLCSVGEEGTVATTWGAVGR